MIPYATKNTIPNQVIYVIKEGKISKNLPKPLTPETIDFLHNPLQSQQLIDKFE